MRASSLGALLLIVATAGRPAQAQEPGPSPDETAVIPVESVAQPEAPPDALPAFEDVLVTATRREAASRDVPQGIAAVRGSDLEAAGASALRDFVPLVPGVDLTEMQPDLFRIAIRGIQTDVGATTPQATGIFIDDVPLNDRFLLHSNPDLPPFDLDAVEILKGPQGTLFGGSALAGAIRYRLKDAEPGVAGLRGYGQYAAVEDGSPDFAGGAAANVPVGTGDAAALRLVAVQRRTGGTIDDLRNQETDTDKTRGYSARGLLRWNVTEALSIGLKAFGQETEADDVPLAETRDGELSRQRALRKSPSLTEAGFGSLDVTVGFDWAQLVSTTSLLRKQGDFANAYAERVLGAEQLGQPIGAPTAEDIDGLAQELRLVSPAAEGNWEWLAGVFADRYHFLGRQRIFTQDALGNESVLLDFDADVRAAERAAFGELSRRIGERWKATLGLRGYRVETEGAIVSSGAIILATGSPENRNDARVCASGLSPKAAVQFAATPHIDLYLTVARGFRFGGIQLFGPSPAAPNIKQTYTPDSLWSYELGTRTLWLDRTLGLDVAAYFIDWEDPQVQTTTGGAVPLNTIDNAGHARSYGGEGQLRYRTPLPGLEVRLAGAYTNARITEPYTAPSGSTVPGGARLPGSADHHVVAAIGYGRSWGPFLLDASVAGNLVGEGVSDIEQSMSTHDYRTIDLRLSLGNAGWPGAPRLSLAGLNLEDERAVVAAFVEDANNFTTIYNRPRTLQARLDLEF